MRIVNRDELAKMPNGTLYCCYQPDCLDGEWSVITGHNNRGFNGVLPLEPFIEDGSCEVGEIRITNWSTVDTCDYDYDDDQLFAVFSKTEIRAMITVLQYALADCNFDISKFMDTYYYGDIEIDEKDIDGWLDESL